MKQTYLYSLAFLLCMTVQTLFAQTVPPLGVHYQGMLRDNGQILANTTRDLRLTLLNGTGATVYQETHVITTNDYGLFTTVLGEGTVTFGFWPAVLDSGVNMLRSEINDGTGWILLGVKELQSVPYALNTRWADSLRGFEGRRLDELSNVESNTPAAGQILKYDGLFPTILTMTLPTSYRLFP